MTDKEKQKYQELRNKIETYNPWKTIEFTIDIQPEPYARPRKSRKLENMGKSNIFYNPRTSYHKKLKKEISTKIEETISSFQLIEGEIHLSAEFGLTPPKKYTDSKNKLQLVKDSIIKPMVRPDIDNWVKPIMDSLNKLVYEDDGQITELHVSKVYSVLDHPYIKLKIEYRQEPIKLKY